MVERATVANRGGERERMRGNESGRDRMRAAERERGKERQLEWGERITERE